MMHDPEAGDEGPETGRPDGPEADLIRRHVEALVAPYARERRAAAEALAQCRQVPAWLGRVVAGALLRSLGDTDPRTREASARALGYLGGPLAAEAADRLMSAIDDPNPYVCGSAVAALGLLRAEAARGQLTACLEDSSPRVVAAAIGALARLGPPEIAADLARFLDARQPHVLAAAALAMGTLGHRPAAPKLLENLRRLLRPEVADEAAASGRQVWAFHLPRCHIEALVGLGHIEAVPLLLEVARSHVGLRSGAAAALTRLDPSGSAPKLAWMLRDPSSKLRATLLRLLDRADLPEVAPFVRPLLRDSSSENRRLALAMLRRWGDRGALEDVRRMCAGESNPHLRPVAVATLSELEGERAAAELLPLADDPNPSVRRAVAEALARMAQPSAAASAVLGRLAADPDARVADAARSAPTGHTSEVETPPPRSDLVPIDLWPEAPRLRTLLGTWRAGLGGGSGETDPALVLELDAALGRLIEALDAARLPAGPGV